MEIFHKYIILRYFKVFAKAIPKILDSVFKRVILRDFTNFYITKLVKKYF